MRARSILVAFVASACAIRNPDPRKPTVVQMQQEGLGGWIVVTTPDVSIEGELISIEPDELRVLDEGSVLHHISFARVVKADLFAYVAGGWGTWGTLGTVSTISHGLLAAISAPIWITATAINNRIESRHAIRSYPDEPWTAFAAWARFPQGMPPQLGDHDLVEQVRTPAKPKPPPPPPPPVEEEPPEPPTPRVPAPEPEVPTTPTEPTAP
jgi:hypothetical protein